MVKQATTECCSPLNLPLTPTACGATRPQRSHAPVQAVGGNWVADALGGSARQGALTEAKLNDELGPNYNIPGPMRRARTTISWWQVRC